MNVLEFCGVFTLYLTVANYYNCNNVNNYTIPPDIAHYFDLKFNLQGERLVYIVL